MPFDELINFGTDVGRRGSRAEVVAKRMHDNLQLERKKAKDIMDNIKEGAVYRGEVDKSGEREIKVVKIIEDPLEVVIEVLGKPKSNIKKVSPYHEMFKSPPIEEAK
ncbi:MAG: hypothetical protein WCX97_01955 [Candidatus Magasanikbacteria bacterium]